MSRSGILLTVALLVFTAGFGLDAGGPEVCLRLLESGDLARIAVSVTTPGGGPYVTVAQLPAGGAWHADLGGVFVELVDVGRTESCVDVDLYADGEHLGSGRLRVDDCCARCAGRESDLIFTDGFESGNICAWSPV